MKRRENSSYLLHLCPPSSAEKAESLYMYGTLARIANDEGMVVVMFDHVSPLAHFEDKECADLGDVTTPPSSEDRFDLS